MAKNDIIPDIYPSNQSIVIKGYDDRYVDVGCRLSHRKPFAVSLLVSRVARRHPPKERSQRGSLVVDGSSLYNSRVKVDLKVLESKRRHFVKDSDLTPNRGPTEDLVSVGIGLFLDIVLDVRSLRSTWDLSPAIRM